jgi:hypothetical protein
MYAETFKIVCSPYLYGIENRLRAGRPGNRALISGRGKIYFSSRQGRVWDPPCILSNGLWGISWRVSEANHTPSRSEVKNAWSYYLYSPYAFMLWCLSAVMRLGFYFGKGCYEKSVQRSCFVLDIADSTDINVGSFNINFFSNYNVYTEKHCSVYYLFQLFQETFKSVRISEYILISRIS